MFCVSVAVCTSLLLTPGHAPAAAILTPVFDAVGVDIEGDGVYDQMVSSTGGDSLWTAIGITNFFGTGLPSSFAEARSIIEFDIGSIPSGSSIVRASLIMTVWFAVDAVPQSIVGSAGDGVQSLSDFATVAPVIGSLTPDTAVLTLDVTSLVNDLKNANESFLSILLVASAADQHGLGTMIFSMEEPTGAGPRLEIVVPAPGNALLLLPVIGFRRRR